MSSDSKSSAETDSSTASAAAEGEVEYLRTWAEAGVDDALHLRPETARQVLTEKRLEIVRTLAEGPEEIEGVVDLAERLDRDPGDVSKDLKRLSKLQIVEFEDEGGSKIPRLKHQNVLVKPILFEGTPLSDSG